MAIAIWAFLLASLLGGVSWALSASGLARGQLVTAGVAEMLLSLVFLIASAGLLYAAARAPWRRNESLRDRFLFLISAGVVGTCWTIMGIWVLRPPILRAAFG